MGVCFADQANGRTQQVVQLTVERYRNRNLRSLTYPLLSFLLHEYTCLDAKDHGHGLSDLDDAADLRCPWTLANLQFGITES